MSECSPLVVFADDIYTCNRTRCGACREECPVYRVRGLETYSCRGKMLVARGILEGRLEADSEMARMADECLLCGYCEARCALHNTEVVTALREELAGKGLRSPEHTAATAQIMTDGWLFPGTNPLKREGSTPVYLGCTYQSRPAEARTVLSVLERAGLDPMVADETCCGYILEATGDSPDFRQQQERFREVYEPWRGREILTLCPTCTITLKEKHGLNVKHALVALADRVDSLSLSRIDLRATYHDPCHLGRMLGVTEEPRRLLRAMGVELIEMLHQGLFSTCCGGGGGVSAVDARLSAEVAKNRVRDAVDVGAGVIVSACPTCVPTLLRGAGRLANEIDRFVDVRDLWALLDESLGQG